MFRRSSLSCHFVTESRKSTQNLSNPSLNWSWYKHVQTPITPPKSCKRNEVECNQSLLGRSLLFSLLLLLKFDIFAATCNHINHTLVFHSRQQFNLISAKLLQIIRDGEHRKRPGQCGFFAPSLGCHARSDSIVWVHRYGTMGHTKAHGFHPATVFNARISLVTIPHIHTISLIPTL